MPKQISMYNLSLLSERSDKSSTFSLKGAAIAANNSPVMSGIGAANRSHQPLTGNNSQYGTKDSQDLNAHTASRVYHLIKPTSEANGDPILADKTSGGGKMMSEIYLTRLLTTKVSYSSGNYKII